METAVKTVASDRRSFAGRCLRIGVTGVAFVGLAAAACSGDDKPSVAPPTTSQTSSTTSPTSSSTPTTVTTVAISDENQAVLTAYRSFWDAYIAASDPMNPDFPGLAERAVGEELDTVRRTLLARKSAGEVFLGTMDLSPRVTVVTGDRRS